jgi:hypothetical protein
VPGTLSGSDAIELLFEGERLLPMRQPERTADGEEATDEFVRVTLPSPQLGTCDLQVRYSIPTAKLPPNASVDRPIPLVMPAEGELAGNDLYVTAPQGVEVQLRQKSAWSRPEEAGDWHQRHNGVHLASGDRQGEVVLRVRQRDRGATVVERAWIQTLLAVAGRRERAVFCVSTRQNELELILPTEVDAQRMQAWLGPEAPEDREPVKVQSTPEGRLVVPLPPVSEPRRLWLEIRYDFDDPRAGAGGVSVGLPGLGGDVTVRRIYWELLLPPSEHVIVMPGDLTAEIRWGWNGLFWGRNAVKDESELAAWSGADPRYAMPKGANRYLFSSLGAIRRCELRTASRWLIVLIASTAVLTAGLLLIYVPASRHPALLLVAGVVMIGISALFPEPALLTLQAAGLGMAMALLAALLYRTLSRGPQGRPRREPSSSVFEKGSTQGQPPPAVVGNQASTDTAPAPMPMPSPDSNR